MRWIKWKWQCIKYEVIPLHTISTSITLNSQYAMYNPCVHPILCSTPRTVEPLKKEAELQVNSDEYQNKVEPLLEPSTVQPSIQYDPKCGNPDEFECVMDKPWIPEISLPCSSLDTSFKCNMMHCESESCYSSHCNVKSGDFELEDYDYDLDYDGIYNYPEYDDYAMDYNYTCGVQKGKRRDCEF